MNLLYPKKNFSDTVEFADYKEFLLYSFNSIRNTGKLDDVIFKVRNQPKAKPFDYNYNTQEGNKEQCLSYIKWNLILYIINISALTVNSMVLFKGRFYSTYMPMICLLN